MGGPLPDTSLMVACLYSIVTSLVVCYPEPCHQTLMTSQADFNYRNNIFTVVMSLLSTSGVDDEVSKQ